VMNDENARVCKNNGSLTLVSMRGNRVK
jgi:hypothetical protein